MNIQELPIDPFDSMPIVLFHERPVEHHNLTLYDCISCTIQSGARIEVWRVKDSDGVQIRMRRPIESGRQSLLKFGLTRDAAEALFEVLHATIFTTPNAKDVAAVEDSQPHRTACSPSPRSACYPSSELPTHQDTTI